MSTCNLPVLAIDTAYFRRDEAGKGNNAEGKLALAEARRVTSTYDQMVPAACTSRDCLRKAGLPEE